MAADPISPLPPTTPLDELPPEPAKWPKTVGTISVIWAGLSLLCGLCGVGWMIAMPKMMAGAEQQMGGPMPDIMKPSMAQLGLGVIGFVPTILLLIAGILTVMRRPAGRPLHLAYAVLALVIGIAAAAIGVRQQLAILQWAQQQPASDKWAQNSRSPIGLVISVAVIAFTMAWPVFCLLWFGAVKRDTRDLSGPGPEPAA
jgi:hypothetical protein